jgi:putative hydrolase of the HAD superfamily
VLEAVLFDWGDTLFHFAYEDDLLERGWADGLAVLGRDGLPDESETAAVFREHYLPLLVGTDSLDELEYPGVVVEVLGRFGIEPTEEELERFLVAEHAAWAPARQLGAHTHSLLDSIRDRGLKTGLVSNAFDPEWLLLQDLEAMGLRERLDVAVFSSAVGKRKPHPLIFETALQGLGVAPADALFVGDRRYPDMQGAKELGMTTVQAFWFHADTSEEGMEGDYEAFTPMDVLNIVRRLIDER